MRFSIYLILFLSGCTTLPEEELNLSSLYHGKWVSESDIKSIELNTKEESVSPCSAAVISPVVDRRLLLGDGYVSDLKEYRNSIKYGDHKGSYSLWSTPYAVDLLLALGEVNVNPGGKFKSVIETKGSIGLYSGSAKYFSYFDDLWPYWHDNFDEKAYKLGYLNFAGEVLPEESVLKKENKDNVFIYRNMGEDDRNSCTNALRKSKASIAVGSFFSIDFSRVEKFPVYSAYIYVTNERCEMIKAKRYDFNSSDYKSLLDNINQTLQQGYSDNICSETSKVPLNNSLSTLVFSTSQNRDGG